MTRIEARVKTPSRRVRRAHRRQEKIRRLYSRAYSRMNPLVVGIARNTSAKRAAALRFAEKGRKLLRSGDSGKALVHLEKALALDPSPYIYFYLARAHYYLARYQQALNFLQIAESWLTAQADWVGAVADLREDS